MSVPLLFPRIKPKSDGALLEPCSVCGQEYRTERVVGHGMVPGFYWKLVRRPAPLEVLRGAARVCADLFFCSFLEECVEGLFLRLPGSVGKSHGVSKPAGPERVK